MIIDTVTPQNLKQIIEEQLNLQLLNVNELLDDIAKIKPGFGIKIARKQEANHRFVGQPLDSKKIAYSGVFFKGQEGLLRLIRLDNRNKIEGKKNSLIGEGGYSTVKPAFIGEAEKVVKRINVIGYLKSKNKALTHENIISLIKQHQHEVELMRELHRDVELVMINSDYNIKLYILMENLGVSLSSVIKDQHEIFQTKKIWFTLEQELNFFIKMMREVMFIHQKGIVHSDLKPSNFTLKHGFQIVAIDFNLSKRINNIYYNNFGTFAYFSAKNLERFIKNEPAINNVDSDFSSLKRCFLRVMGRKINSVQLERVLLLKNEGRIDEALKQVGKDFFKKVVDDVDHYQKNHSLLKKAFIEPEKKEVFTCFLELRNSIIEEMCEGNTFGLLIEDLSNKLNQFAQLEFDAYQRYLCLVIDDILLGVAIEERAYNARFEAAIIYVTNEIIPKLWHDLKVKITVVINDFSIALQMIEKAKTTIGNYLNKTNIGIISWITLGYQAKNGKICATIFSDLLREESTLAVREKFFMIYVLLGLDIDNIKDLKDAIVLMMNKTSVEEASVFVRNLVEIFYEMSHLDPQEKIKTRIYIDCARHKIIQHLESEIHKLSWSDEAFDKEFLHREFNGVNMQFHLKLRY